MPKHASQWAAVMLMLRMQHAQDEGPGMCMLGGGGGMGVGTLLFTWVIMMRKSSTYHVAEQVEAIAKQYVCDHSNSHDATFNGHSWLHHAFHRHHNSRGADVHFHFN